MHSMPENSPLTIAQQVVLVREQKVLIDSDLAALYNVSTKRFNEQVKRNRDRFPADFMFQLTSEEYSSLRSQFATLKAARGEHRKYLPYVFTEHGAIMASMILNSSHATSVSVYVVRAFIQLRELATSNTELALRLEALAQKTDLIALNQKTFEHDAGLQIKQLIDALRELMSPPPSPKKRPIGFIAPEEDQ